MRGAVRRLESAFVVVLAMALGMILWTPTASADCVCQTQTVYSFYALEDGSSCTQLTNDLLFSLPAQAQINCVLALGYDDACGESISLGSCYFSNGQYHQDGTILYSCLYCFINP
jgi:hypothetical protein